MRPIGVVAFVLVTPDEIRALRQRLRCTMQELAAALDVEPRTVISWEDAELFPTKAAIDRMRALDERGPTSIPRTGRRRAEAATPMAALADPEVSKRISDSFIDVAPGTAAEFGQTLKDDWAKYSRITQDAGIKPE